MLLWQPEQPLSLCPFLDHFLQQIPFCNLRTQSHHRNQTTINDHVTVM